MVAHGYSPSAQIWLDDFQPILALSPVTEHAVQGIVYFTPLCYTRAMK